MKLYIVRHGETIHNKNKVIQGWTNSNLTKKGKEQARKLGERLSKEPIEIVYCSDLRRCKDTIAPFLKLRKDIPIKYSRELRERRWGIFEGKKYTVSEKWRNRRKINFDDVGPPKGESIIDVQKRIIKFFNKIHKKEKGKNVLFVTHGGTKRALIVFLLNRQEKKMHKKYRSPNTGLSIIKINENGKHRARLINSTKHLDK